MCASRLFHLFLLPPTRGRIDGEDSLLLITAHGVEGERRESGSRKKGKKRNFLRHERKRGGKKSPSSLLSSSFSTQADGRESERGHQHPQHSAQGGGGPPEEKKRRQPHHYPAFFSFFHRKVQKGKSSKGEGRTDPSGT